MKRFIWVIAATAILITVAAACQPLSTPGGTTKISFVSTTTIDGWKYDYYRNNEYPCAVSGYQTFVIGTKVGSPAATPGPLFVLLHGGGAGYFDAAGNPIPSKGQKVEESAASLDDRITNQGLLGLVRADPAGFRTLAVSYCSHDVYAGVNNIDPNNPNTTPEGWTRLTNGTLATKAAIQFASARFPTTKTFLNGISAGSAGAFGVAWSMQQQGIPPAGVIADASIINVEALQAAYAAGICTDDNDPVRTSAIAARVNPDLANPANEADKLVADGRLTVPIMHIWNHADHNTCGDLPVACPLHDGTTVTMGITDCIHEPMRRAIAAQGPTSKSKNLPVCVSSENHGTDCTRHVVTPAIHGVNTDPASPADYNAAIMDWVDLRLND